MAAAHHRRGRAACASLLAVLGVSAFLHAHVLLSAGASAPGGSLHSLLAYLRRSAAAAASPTTGHWRWGLDPCVQRTAEVRWEAPLAPPIATADAAGNASDAATIDEPPEPAWAWELRAARRCSLRQLGRQDALAALGREAWFVVAGDSQARLLLTALLRLLLLPSKPLPTHPRHSSFEVVLAAPDDGVRASFLWSPYPTNLTATVGALARNGTVPDVLVLGAGLWHMLWTPNADDYRDALTELREAVASLVENVTGASSNSAGGGMHDGGSNGEAMPHQRPAIFWLGLPELITGRLNTERKRAVMTAEALAAYEEALLASRLLLPDGPCTLVDLRALSRGCGGGCTEDGIHYDAATYDAAVQGILNAEEGRLQDEERESQPRMLALCAQADRGQEQKMVNIQSFELVDHPLDVFR
eukprot:SM000170S02691  [mRNA]  locus=s170:296607:300962:- [translate_table: standard]